MAKKKVKKTTTTRKATRPARQAAPRKRRKSGNGDAGASLEQLADQIVAQAAKGTDPALEIPIRSLSNVKFNVKSRLIEMGSNTQQRSLFNYGQAKRFMQTMLVASKCKELIDAGKSASIRQIYYMSKHTIKGTTEKTFDDQAESDPVLEDLEVASDSLREELHVFADSKGALIGDLQFIDSGDLIDASRLGSGGYAYIPPGSLGFNMQSDGGARILYFLDDIVSSALIRTPLILDSSLVDWQATDAIGVFTKDLRADPGSGGRTWLLRVEPQAQIAWQSTSVLREGYLVSGQYRDSECVNGEPYTDTYFPGGYFHRPANSVYGGSEAAALVEAIWFLRESTGSTTVVTGCKIAPQ